ncbi:hypothetical protein MMC21_005717 [Puttea exsequens]|nr:hypothetical protein [Puttea exsequens]
MSFTRAFTTKALPLARSRAFATSPHVRKSATEQAKETVHKVNRAVSDELVKGIEKGQEASESLKSATGINAEKTKGKAEEVAGEAKGKAHELAGDAKGKKEEMKGKAYETKEEAKEKV